MGGRPRRRPPKTAEKRLPKTLKIEYTVLTVYKGSNRFFEPRGGSESESD